MKKSFVWAAMLMLSFAVELDADAVEALRREPPVVDPLKLLVKPD